MQTGVLAGWEALEAFLARRNFLNNIPTFLCMSCTRHAHRVKENGNMGKQLLRITLQGPGLWLQPFPYLCHLWSRSCRLCLFRLCPCPCLAVVSVTRHGLEPQGTPEPWWRRMLHSPEHWEKRIPVGLCPCLPFLCHQTAVWPLLQHGTVHCSQYPALM